MCSERISIPGRRAPSMGRRRAPALKSFFAYRLGRNSAFHRHGVRYIPVVSTPQRGPLARPDIPPSSRDPEASRLAQRGLPMHSQMPSCRFPPAAASARIYSRRSAAPFARCRPTLPALYLAASRWPFPQSPMRPARASPISTPADRMRGMHPPCPPSGERPAVTRNRPTRRRALVWTRCADTGSAPTTHPANPRLRAGAHQRLAAPSKEISRTAMRPSPRIGAPRADARASQRERRTGGR